VTAVDGATHGRCYLDFRTVTRRLLLALAVAVAAFIAVQGRAAAALAPCGNIQGLECAQVDVPLDYTGLTPGTISLRVQVLQPDLPRRGTMFLLAGGPGQGSAGSYALDKPANAEGMRRQFPGYTLVAFDNRGTGDSGALNCPVLQRTAYVPSVAKAAQLYRDCAAIIGPARVFYATRDHAEDIESIRKELTLGDKVGLYGVSYGTKLALAYALAHPDHVERLLLVSVLPPGGPDPYARDVISQMPGTLRAMCTGTLCRGATSNLAGDVAAVANRLEAHPARAKIQAVAGKTVTVKMTGEDLISLVVDSDLQQGVAAELPAAVHDARTGYMRPLLRLFWLDAQAATSTVKELSVGLFAATTCADGLFPWSPATPVAQRPAVLAAAVAALPAGTFGPFGKWAAHNGPAYSCQQWPAPAGQTPLGTGPFPNVPVLAISGGRDFRTPTANAEAVVKLFPHGHVLVVPGIGHDPLDLDLTGCSYRAVQQWILLDRVPAATCPRVPLFTKVLTVFPRRAVGPSSRGTVALVAKTVREASASWFLPWFSGKTFSPAGLYGGKLTPAKTGLQFTLSSYAIVPGLRVSGTLKRSGSAFPFAWKGTLKVSGAQAAAGTVRVTPNNVSGKLGGRRVSASL
jgi:pimeloyl-ACP methyl ester carboxylesterase